MPVNLPTPTIDSIIPIDGIRLGSTYGGIRKIKKDDICAILLEKDATVAGVFTQNVCSAAPVQLAKKHLAAACPRAFIINAGCANAVTGDAGLKDAMECCHTLAKHIHESPENILPFSTGAILERLPMEKMKKGINIAATNANRLPLLGINPEATLIQSHQKAWLAASNAIMTTDTVAKLASAKNDKYSVTGMTKGSGMIHPNMATMLGFIACNARVTQTVLQTLIQSVNKLSFNTITVDGDTSTNDSFMLIATNKTGALIDCEEHHDYQLLSSLILTVAEKLAQAIVRDGEGATKFVTIHVTGGKTPEESMQVAEKIALSPLVKTAFFASDANLGRILSAIGNSGVANLDMAKVSLLIGDVLVAKYGSRATNYNTANEAKALAIMAKDEFSLTVNLARGAARATKYTCDYSYDYIRINAEYRT